MGLGVPTGEKKHLKDGNTRRTWEKPFKRVFLIIQAVPSSHFLCTLAPGNDQLQHDQNDQHPLKHTGVLNIKQPDHMDTSQILPHHYITQKVKKVYCPSSLRPLSLPSMFPKKGWWKRLAVPKIFLIQKIQKRA